MLKFLCFAPDRAGPQRALTGAHLIGADGVPARGEAHWRDGTLECKPRGGEAVGVSLLWPVRDFGLIQLETTRLPPREEPYHLHVELARHRLMRISTKREEWGLFDYPGMEEISEQIEQSRNLFIQSVQHLDDPPRAAELADESLALAVAASEAMCRFHASIFLSRRRQSGGFSSDLIGVAAHPDLFKENRKIRLSRVFDFVRIPFVWRQTQPTEHSTVFDAIDATVTACHKSSLTVRGGPLLNFGVQFLPDWMYIWENDYETIVDFAREHVRRCVQRYANKIPCWIVASGLHADSAFQFTFEQIMDLTRMAVRTTKQVAPRAQVVLDLTQPWGEYFARNQQTVPPQLYAEMAVQSAIPFDAFGLQFLFGIDTEGYRLRDLLQISTLIDRLANLGKPLHITAVAVPSSDGGGGVWRGPWSDERQAEWYRAFSEVALSKPYVESMCAHTLTDAYGNIPSSGLLRSDLSPKPVIDQLSSFREAIRETAR